MSNTSSHDFTIQSLGERTVPSPLGPSYPFVDDADRLLFNKHAREEDSTGVTSENSLSIEQAGPRESLFFEPAAVHAAIVTCGGLCPGINDVIRSIVMGLFFRYGVTRVRGFKYGFQGLIPRYGHEVVELHPENVKDIHALGGSVLSTSRGGQNISELVDSIEKLGINIFFCIGGDGTMKAADLITEEITRRHIPISVVGIPKTIDNDLNLIDKSFGFDTAISEVVKVISCAHVEAKGNPMGIGLVKVMGRESGFIAASATLAQNDVNYTLVPEVPFSLHGEKGFLLHLEQRLKERKHAVILVSEGAGQYLRDDAEAVARDASGNVKLFDIGLYLKDAIETYFSMAGLDISLKYIDPSYIIRSVPADASDSLYCELLGQYAVHAAMAGKTGMLVGLFNGDFVHFPLKAVTTRRKIDTSGPLWLRVLDATGQPLFVNE